MSQYTVVVKLDTYTQVKTSGRYFVATLFSSLDLLEWNIYLKGKYMFYNLKKKIDAPHDWPSIIIGSYLEISNLRFGLKSGQSEGPIGFNSL